jgi:hypothetical protein
MANLEHLKILGQGVETWNAWRDEHRDLSPDLSRADLSKAALREARKLTAGWSTYKRLSEARKALLIAWHEGGS